MSDVRIFTRAFTITLSGALALALIAGTPALAAGIPAADGQTALVRDTAATQSIEPVVAAVDDLVVTSPAAGATLDTRQFYVTGEAPAGSALSIDSGGRGLSELVLEDDASTWEMEVFVGYEAETTYVLNISGTDAAGAPLTPVDLTVTVPALLPTPTITSPSQGSTVFTADQVRLSGRGVAGEYVYVSVFAADEATQRVWPATDGFFPEGFILTQPDGSWAAQLTRPAGRYTARVFHASPPGPGSLEAKSDFSQEVTFTLAVSRDELAATGAVTQGLLVPAGLLLLGGSALVIGAGLRRKAATV